jgi:hypothetical protein
MKQPNNVTDFEQDKVLRQRLRQDAEAFDQKVDAQIKAALFDQIDQLSESSKFKGDLTTISQSNQFQWKWASFAAVLAVVALSLSMTEQQQDSPPTLAANQNYDPIIVAYQPIQSSPPMIQSQVLTNEYAAILSDIEKLATRIRVD